MKKQSVLKVFIAMLIIVVSFVTLNNNVFADFWGTNPGSGGVPGCGTPPMSTCYGAAWKWYSWEDIESGRVYGMSANGRRVTIEGTISGTRNFAKRSEIDVNDECVKSGNGLWRYAMVAWQTLTYGSDENHLSVREGEQVGLIGINKNSNSIYDSEYYGGATNYDAKDANRSMKEAYEAYTEFQRRNPHLYPIKWDEAKGADDALSWFCGPPEATNEPEFYAISNVSNSGASGYATTGINNGPDIEVANTDDVILTEKNQTLKIVFSHNVYSTEEVDDKNYQIILSGFDGNGYTMTPVPQGANQNANFTEKVHEHDRDFYVPSGRISSSSGQFIYRQEYEVTFTAENVNKRFCQTVVLNGKRLTQACTRVIVKDKPQEEGLCGYGRLGPYNPSTGETWVLSRALNPRLSGSYYSWQKTTYAMPGDEVSWINCYFPGSHYYAFYGVTEINGEEVAYHDSSHNSCGCTSNGYVTYAYNTGFDWTNQAKVTTMSPYGFNEMSGHGWYAKELPLGPYNLGDTTKREVQNNYYIDYKNDVANTNSKWLTDTIFTDTDPIVARFILTNHSWTQQCCSCRCGCITCSTCCGEECGSTCYYSCPVNCNCTHYWSHCNTYNIGNYSHGTRQDESQVIVPFNYINTVDISVDRTLTYSGEEIGVVNGYVKVGVRENRATEATYATYVRNAHVKMMAFVSSSNSGSAGIRDTGDICSLYSAKQCATVIDYYRDLNDSGTTRSLSGSQNSEFNGTYNTFDASAGDYMCFAAAVYPATSGYDTNTSESGDGKWYVTAPKCAIIAKKPSMRVTGGSVFTNGSIRTNISSKHNLYNISGYRAMGGSTTSFGSWAEEAIIANGRVTNFASGAAIGRSSNGAGYGVTSFSFCGNGIPLSFANYTNNNGLFPGLCGSLGGDSTGSANISSSFISKNHAALVDYFATGNSSYGGDAYFILGDTWLGEDVPSGTGKDIWYYNINGTANIMGGSLGKSTTRVVKAKNVNISQPITYDATGLRTMGEVPKAVIYSAGDIHISCDVERVDAILIAEGTVYTCNSYTASGGNLNDYNRSKNQLVINGAVIANQVELGRTYGNAAGVQSGTAAEVINYDTSSLIWSRSMAGAGESDTLTTVYVRELSPRY